MQIVIDIPEKIYHACVKTKDIEVLNTPKSFHNVIEDAIANGAVLPKGHGRLVDADMLWNKLSTYTDDEGATGLFGNDSVIQKDSAMYMVENAPTIMEADKEVGNGEIDGNSRPKKCPLMEA